MADRALRVTILGDSRDLQREFRDSTAASKKFGRDMSQSTRTAQVGFVGAGRSAAKFGGVLLGVQAGAAGLGAAMQTSVDAASNLAEQTAKAQQVFRSSSRDVEVWATTAADGFAIAEDKALEAAGTFGNLFRTVGLGAKSAAGMSQALVELAADLASFNNTDPSEALDALRSGLIGEAEPLRRFGVLLSEVRVQQQAMETTGKKNAKALTNQEKALARYAIILNDTKTAQGDFARTSDSFANQTRKLQAQLRDLSADVGGVVVPALSTLIDGLNATADAARKAKDALAKPTNPSFAFGQHVADVFFGLGETLGVVESEADQVAAAIKRIADRADQLRAASLSMGGALREALALKRDAFDLSPGRSAATEDGHPINITAEQRNKFFDAKIARRLDKAQDLNLRGQVAELKKIEATIQARIKVTKDITRKENLGDDLRGVRRERKAVEAQIADNAEAARLLKLDKEREAIEAARVAAAEKRERNSERLAKINAKRTARQFARLGLGPTGGELVPTKERLRQQLGTVTAAVKGTFLDTAKTRALLAGIRKNINEALVPPEVRSRMRDLLRDLTQQLKDTARGPLTKTSGLNTKKILAGLGLDPDQIRELRGRLSGFNTAGRANVVPAAGGGGFVGGRPIVVESHTTVELDGHIVGKVVTRGQQKKRRRNPPQRRGPNAGMAL